MRTLLLSLLFLIMLSSISLAAPFLHDLQPMNNTYAKGGTLILSINITDNILNASSAIVKIIELGAYQQGEQWVTQTLSCTGGPIEWKCSTNFITSTIGSDTIELFYFEANNTSGATGNNGTATNPLRFTIDREPPLINFVNPTNNSYVSGNKTIVITVTDVSSGVNNNTAQYSADNVTWTTMRNVSMSSFENIWNTTTFSNNQTVTLYVKASDNVKNNATMNINVTVDNEAPQIVVSSLPSILIGNVQLQANVSDNYSGISFVRYTVGSLSETLGCTGGNYSATCSAVLNTANLQDGNYTLTFAVTDRAGNSNSSSMQIKTVNVQPSISILAPANNAFVKGIILVRISVVNAEGVNYVELSVEKTGNITSKNMTCNLNFSSCNYSLDTLLFADGGYTVRAKAINILNLDVSSVIGVTIDNTKPSLTITQPTTDVRGEFEIKVDVTDVNLNQSKVLFNITSFNGSLVCTPQTPSRFICSTVFNSRQLNNGNYTLNVSAEDKAGNLIVASKEIIVANQPSSGAGAGSAGQTEITQIEINKNETKEEQETSKQFPGISITLKSQYIILGIVAFTVLTIVIILAITVSHRFGKTIITEDRI